MPGFRGSRTAGSQRGSRVQWRLCADYECLKGQMQAGRARIKRTPCRCCGGVWRWAVGVCWLSSSGKVEIEEESPEKTCGSQVLEEVAAIKDAEGETSDSWWPFSSHGDTKLSLSTFRRKTSQQLSLSTYHCERHGGPVPRNCTSLGASLDDEYLCPTQPLTTCKDHQGRSVKGQERCLACLCLAPSAWTEARLTQVHAGDADGVHVALQMRLLTASVGHISTI
ncbi:hypothetical protein BU25DRAFT_481182 [Macroventuria anomochaeta]|uniref:Uncharacterized protein n=1 Tax=Macroventuria anomochaeta TaxID=301207 RepID=A0ACB6RMA6_9PLEO|nr:uncharacterized protein BU25DRAFT_481182 [Macroventuria anomochaeta]KAF2622087.1 hypothetical protein BU25DRAFT_481182 [Macroventuria anomochaeta]